MTLERRRSSDKTSANNQINGKRVDRVVSNGDYDYGRMTQVTSESRFLPRDKKRREGGTPDSSLKVERVPREQQKDLDGGRFTRIDNMRRRKEDVEGGIGMARKATAKTQDYMLNSGEASSSNSQRERDSRSPLPDESSTDFTPSEIVQADNDSGTYSSFNLMEREGRDWQHFIPKSKRDKDRQEDRQKSQEEIQSITKIYLEKRATLKREFLARNITEVQYESRIDKLIEEFSEKSDPWQKGCIERNKRYEEEDKEDRRYYYDIAEPYNTLGGGKNS